jgi:hypothetical protein
LDKDPLLTASSLAQMIGIPLAERKKALPYLKTLKHDWKGNHENQRGSIRSIPDEFHNVFYRGTLPSSIIVNIFLKLSSLEFGFRSTDFILGAWISTKSKNKYFLYKSRLGRIRLFSTGTVELFVRKPAIDGKCMQLFCDAFTKTNLIDSIKLVEDFQKGMIRKMHCTFDVGLRVPYAKITAFQDSHNFTMVSGDRSHPTSFEFMFNYNSEVKSTRALVDYMGSFFKSLQENGAVNSFKGLRHEDDYSR